MPPLFTDSKIYTGIHDFKTNISQYIRLLDSGDYESLVLTSRGRKVGMFVTFKGLEVQQAGEGEGEKVRK